MDTNKRLIIKWFNEEKILNKVKKPPIVEGAFVY